MWLGKIQLVKDKLLSYLKIQCVSSVKGVVSGELCQQQEHGSGEGGPFSAQRNLSEGTHL